MSITASNWEQLSGLLDQALDLEPEQRLRWLETLAPEFEHLKGTLSDLLASSDGVDTGSLLKRIPNVVDVLISAPAPDERIGPYKLVRELGAGGMATVWLAERADGSMQRQVALKLPRPAFGDRGLIDRVRRERDILASLEHPNIARLYDAGADADGRPYLALEYVDGVPVDVYCRQHALPLRQRLHLFLRVARAVAFAHARLIVHRDLKPTNVLVKSDGDVRLLDFGIARLLQSEFEQRADHTQVGGRALTPRYAAPEQFTARPITVATDVYSLGVLLYELLTGKSPYAPKRESDAALEDSILNEAPPLPSSAAPSAIGRALRGDLDSILIKALNKLPADRYASVEAFAADIEFYLQGRPIAARPRSSWYQFRKFISRHKLQVSAAAIALIAIVAGATLAIWQAHEAAIQRDNAIALASRNKAINDFTEMLISEAAASEKPVTVSEMLAQSEKLALSDTSGTPENRAAILEMIAGRYLTVADFGKAAPLFERALALVQDSHDTAMRSRLVCHSALANFGLRQSDAAVTTIMTEIDKLRDTPEIESTCQLDRADMGVLTGDGDSVLKYATLALEGARKVPKTTTVDEAIILGTIADGQRMTGHIEEADRYFELALQKLASMGRERSPDAGTIRSNWAMVSSSAGVPKRAVELYDQSLAILTQIDPGRKLPAFIVYNRARSLEFMGRLDDARDGYELCHRAAQESKNFDAEFYCLLGSASIANELGKSAEAEKFLRQIHALPGVAVLPQNSPLLPALRLTEAVLDTHEGRLQKARDQLEQLLIKKRNSPQTVRVILAKAEVELLQGDTGAASSDAQSALEMSTALQGGVPYSVRTGACWLMLGRVHAARAESADARKAFEAAVTHLTNTADADAPALRQARTLLAQQS